MKRVALMVVLVLLIFLIVVTVLLIVPRKINIYEEYRVQSEKETGGIVWSIIPSEETRIALMKKYNLKIPDVDFNKYYLLWSSGRRIKKITYRMISKYKWRYGVPKGIASFGEEYYPHTAFFYKINKVHLKQDWERLDELLKQRDERRGKQDENQK